VPYFDGQSFTIADIPGIVYGASEGRGLGTQFLRHIERNAVLLFLVAADSEDIAAEYNMLLAEVGAHNAALLQKPRLLVVTKCDLIDDDTEARLAEELRGAVPETPVFISAATGKGLPALKDETFRLVQSVPRAAPPIAVVPSGPSDAAVTPLTPEEQAAFPTVDLAA